MVDSFASVNELRQTSNFADAYPILLKDEIAIEDEVKETEEIKQKWKKFLVTKKIRKAKIKHDDMID